MRRKDLEVTEKQQLKQILDGCKVCRLGLCGEPPYIVPMNFGYSWTEGLTLYFHSASQGRKIDLLREHPTVSFEMDCDHLLVTGNTACRYTYRYASLYGEGKVRFIESCDEKLAALKAIMAHVTGSDDYEYEDASVKHVQVFAVDVSAFTGKRR